jgi:uncharacterized membrane protein
MIDQIESFMNILTDMDWGWWPVLSLRPPKDRDIDNQTLVKLTLVFGSIVGFIFLLIVLTSTGTITLGSFLVSVVSGWLLYFVVYKFTFAYFWNRRARRLRGE